MYKYQDLIENKDSITSWSIDVVSIYDAFRKIFLLVVDKEDKLFHELTWNNFVRNSNFSSVVNKYIFYLFKYLKGDYIGKDQDIKDKLSKINHYYDLDNSDYPNHKYQDEILMIAKDIFKLAKLDGNVKDIILLVENFKIFQNQDFKDKLSKANFEFEPFNGCDIPW